jgi:hypothetical protein
MIDAAFKFVDRNPRWFAAVLITHSMLMIGLLAAPLLIAG